MMVNGNEESKLDILNIAETCSATKGISWNKTIA